MLRGRHKCRCAGGFCNRHQNADLAGEAAGFCPNRVLGRLGRWIGRAQRHLAVLGAKRWRRRYPRPVLGLRRRAGRVTGHRGGRSAGPRCGSRYWPERCDASSGAPTGPRWTGVFLYARQSDGHVGSQHLHRAPGDQSGLRASSAVPGHSCRQVVVRPRRRRYAVCAHAARLGAFRRPARSRGNSDVAAGSLANRARIGHLIP